MQGEIFEIRGVRLERRLFTDFLDKGVQREKVYCQAEANRFWR